MSLQTVQRYCPICQADVEMPTNTLDGMAQAPELIAEAVDSSAPPGKGWSTAEIAAHLADVEVAYAWRLRRVLTEDDPTLQPFDQDVWARVLHYRDRKPDVSLLAYATLRTLNVEMLARVPDRQWDSQFHHPEYGELSLRALVLHISDHDLAHLKQIRGDA